MSAAMFALGDVSGALRVGGESRLQGGDTAMTRTVWGHPDLQGIWTTYGMVVPSVERPSHVDGRAFLNETEVAEAERAAPIREGVKVVIAGPPNAGKSSLLNLLARREAAIVSAIPGTTRDVIEVAMEFSGVPVTMLGVPNRQLFAPLKEEQVQNLYYDDNHLNANGTLYFTRAMLPAILELYERARREKH